MWIGALQIGVLRIHVRRLGTGAHHTGVHFIGIIIQRNMQRCIAKRISNIHVDVRARDQHSHDVELAGPHGDVQRGCAVIAGCIQNGIDVFRVE